MEDEKMNRADLIAILTSIREYAKEHKETKTEEHIKTIIEEVRKK